MSKEIATRGEILTVEAADGSVASDFVQCIYPAGTFRLTTRAEEHTFGDGTGAPVAVPASRHAELSLLRDPELKFGEAYMDGTLVVEQGSIADVLAVLFAQGVEAPKWALPRWLLRFIGRRLTQFNPRKLARSNVAHHYDLECRLYSLFLDSD